jgi:hypothetical protein
VVYLKAGALGIEFLIAKVPKELFHYDPFDLHALFEDIRNLYHFQRLDSTLITIWCLYVFLIFMNYKQWTVK